MGESCHVYCRSGTCDLGGAARLLAECGQTVAHHGDHLTTGWPGGPQFRVWFEAGEHVKEDASEIGRGTDYEAAMRDCDARFEIGIDDLDEALDEINTLIEVQSVLQEATQGFLYPTWNSNLSGP
jgi:hypothetical protein